MSHFLHHIYARIKEFLIPYYILFWVYPKKSVIYRRRIRDIRKRGQANVVFIASSLAMWKYQRLYDLLRGDKRFNPTIILVPFSSFSEEQKGQSMQVLSKYFSERNIPFLDSRSIKNLGDWFQQEISPDLIFYPQPYDGIFLNEIDWTYNQTSLIAYIPYGALTLLEPWIYNNWFINNAWRIYYQSEYNKQLARKTAHNRGKNVRVSGYISSDDFKYSRPSDVWKPQDKPKKKIIWAPHFSGMHQDNWLNRGAFNWLWRFMQDLAITHKDTIQIAFKPHPRLLSELYNHPEWGKEKADAYYAWWAESENTQIETGEFIPLFKGSDAMIHDCNSFIVDYLFVDKPVLFTSANLKEAEEQLDDFGKTALRAHYIGQNIQDVLSFVENLEADGPDPKSADRQEAYKKNLLPPAGVSVAEYIHEDLLSSIKFRD